MIYDEIGYHHIQKERIEFLYQNIFLLAFILIYNEI